MYLMSRLRIVALRVVLAAVAVLITLSLAEVVVRIAYAMEASKGRDLAAVLNKSTDRPAVDERGQFTLAGIVQGSPHKDVVYELHPGLTGRYQRASLNINTAGIRERELPVAKPPGTYRIVGLGDSVMFGWGVEASETFLRQLEDRLNALPGTHPRYETLNFGVPGYISAIEVATLERKALAYQPDLVILHVISNDWGVPKFMQRPPRPYSLDRIYLYDFIRTRLGWIKTRHETSLVGYRLDGIEEEENLEIRTYYSYMLDGNGYILAIDKLADMAKRHGFEVLVLAGSQTRAQKEIVEPSARERGFHYLSIAPVTDRMLRERGLEPGPEVYRTHLQVAPGDPHPNPFGHSVYAQGIFETLTADGLVP